MELFSTSKDLVNLALAVGIIGISAAIVYFFINAAGFIREMRQTINEINRQLENIGQITESVKNKLTYMFSYWSVLEKLAGKAIDLVQKGVVNKVKSKFNHHSSATNYEDIDLSSDELKNSRQKAKITRRSKK